MLFFLHVCLNLVWAVFSSFFILLFTAFAIGLFRLIVIAPRQTYPETLRDASLLKKGDILLTGKQDIGYSWYIQISNLLTRKPKHRFWTHAAIYQGNGKVWEAQPAGVIERELSDYFRGGFLIRAFRHKYISDEKVFDQILQFCAEKKGYSYGMKAVVFYTFSTFMPISFNWLFDNPALDAWLKLDKAYFCSELVVDAFCASQYPVSPYDGWRVKPTDFISNPLLAPVE